MANEREGYATIVVRQLLFGCCYIIGWVNGEWYLMNDGGWWLLMIANHQPTTVQWIRHQLHKCRWLWLFKPWTYMAVDQSPVPFVPHHLRLVIIPGNSRMNNHIFGFYTLWESNTACRQPAGERSRGRSSSTNRRYPATWASDMNPLDCLELASCLAPGARTLSNAGWELAGCDGQAWDWFGLSFPVGSVAPLSNKWF